eukprot:813640-Prorocentrum_lima.AAC.1
MYIEGIGLIESLFKMNPDELGDEVMWRAQTVWVALQLNSALACLKLNAWRAACERVDKVLQVDKAN